MMRIFTIILIIFYGTECVKKDSKKWQRAIDEWTNVILTITAMDNTDYEFFNSTLDNILQPRVPGTIGNERVRKFITNTMKDLEWDVQHDSFDSKTPNGIRTFTNIVATLNPNSCRRLVLACHYDSKDIPGFVGAIDSAVPCSIIIYLAWALNDQLKYFNQNDGLTIQLIFFDGEEAFKKWRENDSLYGSRHLAGKWSIQTDTRACPDEQTEIKKIDLFILLDLIGSKQMEFCSMFWNTHNIYLQLVSIEKQLNRLNVLEKDDPNEYTKYFGKECFLSVIQDDHLPFLQKGVPVLHLIPPNFPLVWHKTSDDRSHLHHQTISNLNKILKLFIFNYLLKNEDAS
ncbi:glutaminyl-peptide cyclotransferase-like [Centruroides vittatus]|uniref:glutaminyl-peptide cyclotransferase-like n=1 Tax=Centruroides vittatus TaxID=120091 RepID=UPI003510A263